jgi:hypothetical protein
MAMSMRYKRGELTKPSGEVKRVAKGMSEGQLREYAVKPKREHHGTPFRHTGKGE